jgi:hypothetical protein
VEVLAIKTNVYLENGLLKEGVWHELLHDKYLYNNTLSQVTAKPSDSLFWKGLMGVKEDFGNIGSFTIRNGWKTRCWEDIWLGETQLAQ